jgi:hypothetical protein
LRALGRLRALFIILTFIAIISLAVFPPALAVALRVAFIYRGLHLIVLAVLVLELRLLVAPLAARLLIFLFLGRQLPVPVGGISTRFRGIQVLPKRDALGSLMCVGELQVQDVDLLKELLALAVSLGAVIGEQDLAGADLFELLLLHETFSEVIEEGLLLLGEGGAGQAPETVHEIQVEVHVRAWH